MDEKKKKEIILARSFTSETSAGFELIADEFGIPKLEVLEIADCIRKSDPRVNIQDISKDTSEKLKAQEIHSEFVDQTEEMLRFEFERRMSEGKITIFLIEMLEKKYGLRLSSESKSMFSTEEMVNDAILMSGVKVNNREQYIEWMKS